MDFVLGSYIFKNNSTSPETQQQQVILVDKYVQKRSLH